MAAMAIDAKVSIMHCKAPRLQCPCCCCGMGWRPSSRIHASPVLGKWRLQANASRIAPENGFRSSRRQLERSASDGGLQNHEEDEDSQDASDDDLSYTSEEDSEEEEEPGFEDYVFLSEEEVEVEAAASISEGAHSDPLADRARKVDELCNSVRANGDFKVTARQLISLYEFKPDKFQRLAIKSFLKGSSVVVSAPTSSGKTLIAEAAAVATLAKCRRLFYTTPLKALSNQKFREFRSVFGDASVGLLTGDISVNRDAPIVIMTAEILRNKLYLSAGSEASDSLVGVDVVVLDEIHYLSDVSRGTVWEETVIYCPKNIQLICLSATIANPEELAAWIEKVHGPTDLITSTKRPVPLMWHISRRSGMSPILNARGTRMNKNLLIGTEDLKRMKRRSLDVKSAEVSVELLQRIEVPRITDTLKQMVAGKMLPAIWFILSRKRCDLAVQYLSGAGLLSPDETEQVNLAMKRFREQNPDGVREAAVGPLYQGVAAHHAGCLPVWKTFIEELFQRGLIKVVFATETLAAGINMPARSTVLSSTIGKGGFESELSANSILQMAGRAGRRGIDTLGHVVVVQTPFRGPKDCYKMLRSGSDPLTSQFTANYGMVLNLLSSSKTTKSDVPPNSLGEARELVEQSFGNFMGSDILLGSKTKLDELYREIEILEAGDTTDSLSRHFDEKARQYKSFVEKQQLAERKVRSLRLKFERLKATTVQKKLEGLKAELPYICLSYADMETGMEHTVSSVYVNRQNAFTWALQNTTNSERHLDAPFIAFGADDRWYRFSAGAVKSIHKSGLPPEKRKVLELLKAGEKWEQVGDDVLKSCSTSSFALEVPASDKLPPKVEFSEELKAAEMLLLSQQSALDKLSKKIAEFDLDDIDKLSGKIEKLRQEKITRLKAKCERISTRITQMVPSGWNEFLQAVKVLKAARAMQQDSYELLPLGEIAKALRGTNELWLALALQDEALATLKPAELAAAASTLVSEGKKLRLENISSTIYEPSIAVRAWVDRMETRRQWLISLQEEHNLEFPCDLDPQVTGFVEAWTSGVSWKELEISEMMDEGDFSRLLRRTIDLLAQVPHLAHVDHALVKNAKAAAKFMDRPPISEVVAE